MRTKGYIVKKCILSIFLIFASTYLWADENPTFEIQSLSALQYKIQSYMLNELTGQVPGKIKVTVNKLDSRIRLRACADEKTEVFTPNGSALLTTNTMGIKCNEEANHWTLYVPVRVSILKTVLLNKKALRKGEHLNNDSLYAIEMDSQKLKQGYYTDPKELLGQVCKHDIPPDTVINSYNIEQAKMVLKGQEVTIIATNGSLKISMAGVALNDGVLGDIIKVKNATSRKIIEAQVSGQQQVKVTI